MSGYDTYRILQSYYGALGTATISFSGLTAYQTGYPACNAAPEHKLIYLSHDVFGDACRLPLVKAIASLTKLLKKIPEEFRDGAEISLPYDEGGSSAVSCSYERPETTAEVKKRVAAHKRAVAKAAKENERAEREVLAALQKKYGA